MHGCLRHATFLTIPTQKNQLDTFWSVIRYSSAQELFPKPKQSTAPHLVLIKRMVTIVKVLPLSRPISAIFPKQS